MIERIKLFFSELKNASPKTLIGLGAVVVIVLALIAALGIALTRKSSETSKKSSGIDTVSIRYGSYPYLAPCGIVTVKDIDKATNGTLTPSGTYAYEVFFDTSTPSERLDPRATFSQSSCRYKSVESRTDIAFRTTTVNATDKGNLKTLLAGIEPTTTTIDQDIAYLEKQVDSSETAKKFVQKLRADKDAAVSYVNSKDGNPPIGAVLPDQLVSKGRATEREVSFIVITKYALVKYELIASEKVKSFTSLSNTEVTSRIETAAKVADIIAKNTSDDALVDKDTNGQLGVTKTPWGMQIVDVCSILNDQLFKQTLGVDPNDRVIQGSFPYNRNFDRQTKERIGYESNSCEKGYREANLPDAYQRTAAETKLGENAVASVSLRVGYTYDAAQANGAITITRGQNPVSIPGSTAEEAYKYNGDATAITFRKGTYVLEAEIKSTDTSAKPTDEQLKTFIDSVLKKIPS